MKKFIELHQEFSIPDEENIKLRELGVSVEDPSENVVSLIDINTITSLNPVSTDRIALEYDGFRANFKDSYEDTKARLIKAGCTIW